MKHRVPTSPCAAAVVIAVMLLGAAQVAAQSDVPRTGWGQPDLQGVWDFRSITPMERPEDE